MSCVVYLVYVYAFVVSRVVCGCVSCDVHFVHIHVVLCCTLEIGVCMVLCYALGIGVCVVYQI